MKKIIVLFVLILSVLHINAQSDIYTVIKAKHDQYQEYLERGNYRMAVRVQQDLLRSVSLVNMYTLEVLRDSTDRADLLKQELNELYGVSFNNPVFDVGTVVLERVRDSVSVAYDTLVDHNTRLLELHTRITNLNLFDGAYSSLTGIPSTFTPSTHTQAWSTITGTPTTLSGYGIIDAFDGSFSSLTGIPSGLSDGDDVNDADSSVTNELQNLSLSGSDLTISLGNTVTLPFGEGSVNDQQLSDTAASIRAYTDSEIQAFSDTLTRGGGTENTTDELQTLSFISPNLSISDGNSVTLPVINHEVKLNEFNGQYQDWYIQNYGGNLQTSADISGGYDGANIWLEAGGANGAGVVGGHVLVAGGESESTNGGRGGHVYVRGGTTANASSNQGSVFIQGGNIFMGDGSTSGSLVNNDTVENLVSYNSTTGKLEYRSVSSIGSGTENTTDELQSLSFTSPNLSISDGNSVSLPFEDYLPLSGGIMDSVIHFNHTYIGDSVVYGLVWDGSKYVGELVPVVDNLVDNVVNKITTNFSNKIVLFGNSLVANNKAYTSGSSIVYDSKAFFIWANVFLNQSLDIVYNAGIGGNTSSDMLSRIGTDVLSYEPDFCYIPLTTNDLNQLEDDFDNIVSRYVRMFDTLQMNGIKVIAATMTSSEYFFNEGDTVKKQEVFYKLNNWIKEYSLENDILLVDVASVMVDPNTGMPKNGWTDGTHPNGIAAIRMGKVIANTIEPFIKKVNMLPHSNQDPINLFNNGMMLGDNSGLADGFSFFLSTGAAGTASKVSRTDDYGGEWQKIEMTTRGDDICDFITGSYEHSLSVGDSIQLYIECKVENASDLQGVYAKLFLQDASYAETKRAYAMFHGISDLDLDYNFSGVLKTPPLVVGEGDIRMRFSMQFNGVGDFYFGRHLVKVINNTN